MARTASSRQRSTMPAMEGEPDCSSGVTVTAIPDPTGRRTCDERPPVMSQEPSTGLHALRFID
jgi:hypothetical protein